MGTNTTVDDMRKVTKKVCLVLALCAALSGCSAMQGIGAAMGTLGPQGPSVDATAQVGKENTQEGDAVLDTRRVEDRRVDAGVEDSKTEVSEVSGVSNVTTSNSSSTTSEEKGKNSTVTSGDWTADVIQLDNVPTPFLILLVLGWLLPGPVEIIKGIGSILMFLRKLVVGSV